MIMNIIILVVLILFILFMNHIDNQFYLQTVNHIKPETKINNHFNS